MAETITREELAKMIDHSLLKPTVTRQDTVDGLEVALKHDVAAATVKPCYVPLAAEVLAGSDVKVNPVICFPLGYDTTATKAFQTQELIEQGAQEIDMVINVGALLGGELALVRDDIAAVVQAAGEAIVKVILEVAYLNDDQVVKACHLCEDAVRSLESALEVRSVGVTRFGATQTEKIMAEWAAAYGN